jgi:EAL domain-containing protein (putative c-di-GMP-specific phosphodiesterase class I)
MERARGAGRNVTPVTRPHPKVLVVDDDPAVTRFLTRALTQLGATDISVAQNGAEALKTDTGPGCGIDLIICDLQMPELDGIEYLRHLTTREFPGAVLLMSGAGERILRAVEGLGRAQNLGVIGVLPKPIRMADLAGALERARAQADRRSPALQAPVSVDELRSLLETDELQVFLQPQADATSKRMVGVEALARWNHPTKGFVPPSVFIPLAEEHGLMDPLTDQVLRRSLAAGSRWQALGLDLHLAVNVSVRNLHRLALPEWIEEQAAEAGFPLRNLVLEVTESGFVTHLVSTLEILTRLRLKGVGLSIDDFGTGYATLEHLQQIPFTELKIDRRFVSGAPHDPTARTILESSVFLARKLGIMTVAEGVESQDEWDLVRELGVDCVQGYYLARPMPEAQLLAWLETHR